MAHICKRSGSKVWSIKYYDHAGKQRWVTGYTDKGETQRLAQRLEDEARKIKLGDIDPQVEKRRVERSRPLEAHIERYEQHLRAKGRSDGHITYTIADIRRLVAYAAEQDTPLSSASDITVGLLDGWVLSLRAIDAPKTINRRVASVQQMLKHLADTGGVTSYVLRGYPKLPTDGTATRRTRPLSREELDRLLRDTPDARRRELYTIAARTGLRLSELRQLPTSAVDLSAGIIVIPARIAKAKRVQTLPIHRDLLPLLSARVERQPPDHPLVRLRSKQTLNRQLREDCKVAKVDPIDVSWHSFRHTFCTLLARANVHPALLQRLARHADLATTLRYYTHLQRADEAAAINQL